MQIYIAQTDIADFEADAVVNPANSLGMMAGGVAGALRRKGGKEIEAEAMSSAPVAVGAAVVTTAGKLKFKAVIHAPTMEEPQMKIGVENVGRATRAALIAASAKKYDVIAMPGMGTGTGRVSPDEAARAMIAEIRAHRGAKPTTVHLVDIDDEVISAFEFAMRESQLP